MQHADICGHTLRAPLFCCTFCLLDFDVCLCSRAISAPSIRQLTVTDLLPNQEYVVVVEACTDGGCADMPQVVGKTNKQGARSVVLVIAFRCRHMLAHGYSHTHTPSLSLSLSTSLSTSHTHSLFLLICLHLCATAPAQPDAPQVTPLDPTSMLVRWTAPMSPNQPITHYELYRNGLVVFTGACTQLAKHCLAFLLLSIS